MCWVNNSSNCRSGCGEVDFPLDKAPTLPKVGCIGFFRISRKSGNARRSLFPTVRTRPTTDHRRVVWQMSYDCPYRRSMFNGRSQIQRRLRHHIRRIIWLPDQSTGLRQPTLSFQLSYASNICAVPLDPSHDFQTDRAWFQVAVAINVERLVLSTCQALCRASVETQRV